MSRKKERKKMVGGYASDILRFQGSDEGFYDFFTGKDEHPEWHDCLWQNPALVLVREAIIEQYEQQQRH